MIPRRVLVLPALLAAVAAAACGDAREPRPGAVGSPPPPQGPVRDAARDSAMPVDTCPPTGRWQLCTVQDRLEDAGLAPRRDTTDTGTVRHRFLSVPGVRYRLGRGEIQLFLYEDTTALHRDIAALDTLRVTPRGDTATWPEPAAFVRSENLVAILLSRNGAQVERVRLALTAGPPRGDPGRR